MINADTVNTVNMVSTAEQQTASLQESLAVSSVASIGRLQDLVERFAAAENKRSVLNELKPAYEKLIAAVDAEHEQVTQIVQEEMTNLQTVLSRRLIETRKAERAVETLLEEIENAALPSCSEVVSSIPLCKRYVEPTVSPDEQVKIEKQLQAYPQLLEAIKSHREAVLAAEPVLLQIDDLEQSLNHCSSHRVKVRYAWADALSGAGSQARSQNVILEAMSIQMGLPVEELKRSRKRRNDRERERERKMQGVMG